MKQNTWKQEWSAAFAVALLTAFLLILPYIIGHLNARPGLVFSGLLVNFEDGTYLSAIEQGRSGAWLYKSHFTVEPHDPVFLEGYYLMLGQVARLLGLSSIAMWHISLFAANLIMFLTIFAFVSLFLKSRRQRFMAYLLALFGAGFDWWRFPAWLEREAALEVVPIDLRFPEAHIFYSALTFPHFIAGITLILLVLGLTLYMLVTPLDGKKRWLLAVGAGLSNLLLGIVYPFLIFLPVLVIGCFYLYLVWSRTHANEESVSWRRRLNWEEIGRVAAVFLIPLPLYIYYAVVFVGSSFLTSWSAQAYTPSPSPLHYFLTYGLYLLLACLYLWKRRQDGFKSDGQQAEKYDETVSHFRAKLLFLWVWVGATAVLLYLPLNSQRRYVEGLQVPLSILATMGFFGVVWPWLLNSRFLKELLKRPRYNASGLQRLTILALIGVAGLANFYLYSSTLIKLGIQQPYPLFRQQAEIDAMSWLKEQIQPGDVVLAGYRTGSYLPFRTGATVIVGNRYETVDFFNKREEAAQFFAPETTDQWRRTFLAEDNIRYIFVGPEEHRLGGESLLTAEYLDQIYQNEAVIIYQVQ